MCIHPLNQQVRIFQLMSLHTVVTIRKNCMTRHGQTMWARTVCMTVDVSLVVDMLTIVVLTSPM